jgi:hypothetical protein
MNAPLSLADSHLASAFVHHEERLRAGNRLHEDELTAGGTDSQMNPMLLRDGALNLGKQRGDTPGLTTEVKQLAEGLIEHTSRLPPELWDLVALDFGLNWELLRAAFLPNESKYMKLCPQLLKQTHQH